MLPVAGPSRGGLPLRISDAATCDGVLQIVRWRSAIMRVFLVTSE